MNTLISQLIKDSRVDKLPAISLQEEINLTISAESYRHQIEHDFNDITRTFDLIESMEGLAIVAQEIKTPTPHQAALIQIGGDVVMAGTDMDGSEITPALEDVKETGQAIASKVRAAIETIIRALRELLSKISGIVQQYMQALRTAVGGHVQRLNDIKERLANDKYAMNGPANFTMAMPLSDEKLLTSLPQLVKDAAVFSVTIDSFIKNATGFNINYASGFTNLYAKLSGDKSSEVEHFSLLKKIADVNAYPSTYKVSTPDDTDLDFFETTTYQTQQLLGGVSIIHKRAHLKDSVSHFSSASLRRAIEELTSHVGLKVVVEHLGFGKEDVLVKALSKPEMQHAVKVCEALIEHFTGKSEHTSLATSATRRLEYAENSIEQIKKYVEKFKKDDVSAQEYAQAVLRVSDSILRNAVQPYSALTTAINRCITLLTNAIIKSLNAYQLQAKQDEFNKDHAKQMQQPSTESFLLLSTERIKDDLVDEKMEVYAAESLGSVVKGFFNIFKEKDRSKNSELQSKDLTYKKGVEYVKETYLNDKWLDDRKWNKEEINCDGQLTVLSINAKPSSDVLRDGRAFLDSLDSYFKKAISALSTFKTQYLKILEPLKELSSENHKAILKSINENIEKMNCPFDKLLLTAPDQRTTFGGISFEINDVRPWYDYRYKFENHFYANGKLKPLNREEVKEAGKFLLELIDIFYGKNDFIDRVMDIEPIIPFPRIKGYEKEATNTPLHFSYLDIGGKQELIFSVLMRPYLIAIMKVIIGLDLLIIKSSTRDSGQTKKKVKLINESIEDVVYSEEGFFGDIIDGIKKALGLRKPTKLNLQEIELGYNDLTELKTKVQKSYIELKHDVKTGDIASRNITPYLFVSKGSEDPTQLPNEWKSALQSAHSAMATLADMMAKSGMEAFAIFKKYSNIEKSVDNFKKMESEFGQFLRKWGSPAKPNLSGVLKNFQLDDMSLLGKNPNIALWDERKVWTMGLLRPSIAAAAEHSKLPMLTSEEIPSVGKAMIEAIDFLTNHQLKDIIKDTPETLMNIEYGNEIVIYDYNWMEEQYDKKTLTKKDTYNAELVERAGDQFEFLYYDLLYEYFAAIISMIVAADRWISASIKD